MVTVALGKSSLVQWSLQVLHSNTAASLWKTFIKGCSVSRLPFLLTCTVQL